MNFSSQMVGLSKYQGNVPSCKIVG